MTSVVWDNCTVLDREHLKGSQWIKISEGASYRSNFSWLSVEWWDRIFRETHLIGCNDRLETLNQPMRTGWGRDLMLIVLWSTLLSLWCRSVMPAPRVCVVNWLSQVLLHSHGSEMHRRSCLNIYTDLELQTGKCGWCKSSRSDKTTQHLCKRRHYSRRYRHTNFIMTNLAHLWSCYARISGLASLETQ